MGRQARGTRRGAWAGVGLKHLKERREEKREGDVLNSCFIN